MNTKTVLMLALSAGMLTALTATMIQATPVYADRDLKVEQENNCRVEDGGADANGGDANGGDNGDNNGVAGAGGSSGNDNGFSCTNNVIEPNTGNDAFNGQIP